MKIAIVGAGAMGCLYGGKLSAVSSNEVYLLDVWKDHIDRINADGLSMEENGKELKYKDLTGATDPQQVGPCDLAVIFVKSTLTAQAVKSNKAVFGPETVALTLQNGLGNIELISSEIGRENVIAGTTAHGATMLGAGHMRHAGSGKTIIGELDGSRTERLKKISSVLEAAGMETELSDNVMGLVWDKLLVNVGINALTGITKLENGKLLEYPGIEEIMGDAVAEGCAVAAAKNIKLGFDDPAEHTREVARATGANRSSMLQDILNGKKTEIDMINGAIVREGEALGIATPVNRVLSELIKYFQSIN